MLIRLIYISHYNNSSHIPLSCFYSFFMKIDTILKLTKIRTIIDSSSFSFKFFDLLEYQLKLIISMFFSQFDSRTNASPITL